MIQKLKYRAVTILPGTFTVTIASPAVVTKNGHGFIDGDTVFLMTSGELPTGLTANSCYYVINKATNTFQLSLTRGGTAINTSGSQSGTHTVMPGFKAPPGLVAVSILCCGGGGGGGAGLAGTGGGYGGAGAPVGKHDINIAASLSTDELGISIGTGGINNTGASGSQGSNTIVYNKLGNALFTSWGGGGGQLGTAIADTTAGCRLYTQTLTGNRMFGTPGGLGGIIALSFYNTAGFDSAYAQGGTSNLTLSTYTRGGGGGASYGIGGSGADASNAANATPPGYGGGGGGGCSTANVQGGTGGQGIAFLTW